LFLCRYQPENILAKHEDGNGISQRFDVFVRAVAFHPAHLEGVGSCIYERLVLSRAPGQFRLRAALWESLRSQVVSKLFIQDTPILVDEGFGLADGAHRFAATIYLGQPLSMTMKKGAGSSPVPPDFLKGSPYFLISELTVFGKMYEAFMEDTNEDLEATLRRFEVNTSGTDHSCGQHVVRLPLVLWPSVEPFFDDILDLVRQMRVTCNAKKNVHIDEVVDYRFGDQFKSVLEAIYVADGIGPEKLARKYAAMVSSVGEEQLRSATTRILWFLLPRRESTPLQSYYSSFDETPMQLLKKRVREVYRDKVSGYVHDIICHSADDQEEADSIAQALTYWEPSRRHGHVSSLRSLTTVTVPVCSAFSERVEHLLAVLGDVGVSQSDTLLVGSSSVAMLQRSDNSCMLEMDAIDLVLNRMEMLSSDHPMRAALSGALTGEVNVKSQYLEGAWSHYANSQRDLCNLSTDDLMQDRGVWTVQRTFALPSGGSAVLRTVRPELTYIMWCFTYSPRDLSNLRAVNRAWSADEAVLSKAILLKFNQRCDAPVQHCFSLQ